MGERNLVLYVDDGRIMGRDPYWVHELLVMTVYMLRSLDMEKNLDKTKSMVCKSGFVWGQIGEAAYNRRATGEGATFLEWKITRLSCS